MLVFFRFYFVKFLYLLVIPGLVFVMFFRKKYDFEKALLFSVPLSLMLFVYPYFLITRAGLPINASLYLLIPGALLIYAIYKKCFSIEFSSQFNLLKTMMLLIVLTVFFLIYHPYSFRAAIPMTEGTNELRAIIDVKDSIVDQGLVPHWSNGLFGGNHYFFIGPPLTTVSTALLSIVASEPIHTTFTMSYSFLTVYLLFAIYVLCKKLKLSTLGAGIASLLIAGVPSIVGELTYAGNLTSAFMYALYPVALYGFFSLFENNEKLDLLIYGFSMAAFFLCYHFIFYYMLFAVAVTILLFLLIKRNPSLFWNALICFGFAGLLILSWFVHHLVISPYIELLAMEGDWMRPLEGLGEFVDFITYTGNSDIHKMTTTITPLFFYLGLFSMFLVFRVKGKKFKVTINDLVVLVFFGVMFFMIISEIFPFHVFIPMRTKFYRSYRFWFGLTPLLAFGIGRLADNLAGFIKGSRLLLPLIFVLLFSSMFMLSAGNVDSWLVEKAIVERERFAQVYDNIDPSLGRVAMYGIFGPAIIPAINRWTGASMFAGYNYERFATKNYYNRMIVPLTRASMDYLESSVSPVRVYNTYQKAWVNYLFFFTCSQSGLEAINKTAQYPFYGLVAESDCLKFITPVNNSYFVEVVHLSMVDESLDKDSLINGLMDSVDGYKLVFTEAELPVDYYTNIVSTLNVSDYVTNSTPLTFTRNSDTDITISGRSGFILVKEPFFPTWSAYQEGVSLELLQSYSGFIIVKSLSNSNISLINHPHPVEYVSLLMFTGLIVILVGVIYKKNN